VNRLGVGRVSLDVSFDLAGQVRDRGEDATSNEVTLDLAEEIRRPGEFCVSPGRIERHGFEYYRHGTLSLYAALETATGRVHGKTTARHTSQDFVAFLEEVVAHCPARQQIHIILDNLSAHAIQALDRLDPVLPLHSSTWLSHEEYVGVKWN
jgi:hypothetical protein